MANMSPSSSPRLPSPPPIAEDQISPKSPAIPAAEDQNSFLLTADQASSRRTRPGTKAEDISDGPPLVDPSQIESAFQLAEHLKALHNHLTHPKDAMNCVPIDREAALRLAQPPEGGDRELWLYELCRFLCEKVNSIIIALFADDPPCSAQTCSEMRASEWQYLCAVHDPPKCCCAIDYCCHTLDWAANTLTSPKHFPSRLALGTDANNTQQQVRQLTNIFRRVYRIFAHAWFQHREVFWRVEGKSGLYVLFKTVTDSYNLIPEDSYTVPPEAEGIETTPINPHPEQRVLWRPTMEQHDEKGEELSDDNEKTVNVSGHTTKLHRQLSGKKATAKPTPSEEKDGEDQASKLHDDTRVSGESADKIEASKTAQGDDPEGGKSGGDMEEVRAKPSTEPDLPDEDNRTDEETGNITEIEIGHEPELGLKLRDEDSTLDRSKEQNNNTELNSESTSLAD